MKLAELLDSNEFRNRTLVTLRQDDTVLAAVRKLAEHNTGALAICNDEDNVVGILTERDIVRKCLNEGFDLTRVRIRDVMSRELVVATPDNDLDYVISVMKQKKIRHLPIVIHNKVAGMISMRDILGLKLEESAAEAQYLQHYISYNLW